MENMNGDFNYAYSAQRQAEIERIRQKYLPQKEEKLEQLRRLDALVEKKARVVSLALGVLGTLVFGAGMSCVMVGGMELYLPGIAAGVAGLAAVAAAYPVHRHITQKESERLGPEILRLSEELLQ